MSEFKVPGGPGDRLRALAGRRTEALAIAVLCGSIVLFGLWLWARGESPRIAPPARTVGAPVNPRPSPVLVHVAGAVRRPGLYEFASGDRTADAIKAAHGPTRRADLAALNLAAPLADGTQVLVPRRGESIAAAPVATPGAPGALVNVNSADQAELELIPGIGPVKAAAIVEYRTQSGAFTALEELLDVTGIGPATLEAMRSYVTV